MSSVPTVFASSVRKIAEAVAPGGKALHLLRSAGLDPDAINDPVLRIPYADMMMLSEHAARITKDIAFGLHVGERVEQHNYGVVGYSVITSATLGEALRCLARYLPIWTNVGAFRLDVEGAVAHFRWDYADCSLPESRHDCEMSMATVARFHRLSSGATWKPREVWFQHPKPRDTSEHARIFRAPVRFGMPANALLLDRKLLELPLRKSRSRSHQAITEAAEQLLAKAAGRESLSQSALSFIRQKLARGDFGVEAISRHLGVSPRTLQRRLRGESSSYRQLIQQARQDLSRFLLLGAQATATETSYALGFSEPSAFLHAFHKWHGMSPRAYKLANSTGSRS
jgi:AraC-like DNA-binding protein